MIEKSLKDRLEEAGLYESIKSLLDAVEDAKGDLGKADQAELRLIDEVRKIGNEGMHAWVNNQMKRQEGNQMAEKPTAKKHGKKRLWWRTTFGVVAIDEQRFFYEGRVLRPLSWVAGIQNRGNSLPLQKAITDFGADVSFKKAVKKLKEHYGVEVPMSAVRDITENHGMKLAVQMENQQKQRLTPEKGVAAVVGETDGSMVPIVKFNLPKELEMEKVDHRKHRQVEYKEARLSLAHQKGSVTLKFSGTMGSVNQTGDQLLDCALQVGMGTDTKIHSVGDGATWIADQVDRVFGAQATFLVDFYHLCEYLAAASKVCAPSDTDAWLTTQKKRLRENKWQSTIMDLRPFLESQKTPDPEAPVRRCLRYMENRTRQMDYKTAIAEGLPIGSGEIESAHGYVIQERLKISGAWWKVENAEKMLALRVARENGLWDGYWAA